MADPKVEAVVIASPQETHREIAEAAFALGKPVLCEKPLGASMEDGGAMVAAAEAGARRHPHRAVTLPLLSVAVAEADASALPLPLQIA